MKRTATSLFLGLCLAILAVAASPAYARSTTGFSAFHVESPTASNPYKCLNENNGAVVNNCTYDVSLEFDLPIDSAGEKSIIVQDYFEGTAAENTFSCTSYAYTGSKASSTVGSAINFTGPTETLTTSVDVTEGDSIQVICYNIPKGGGVANFNWNP
ncbi:MAG: hypothetical protein WCC04_06555 [Terriglobales bacterium]